MAGRTFLILEKTDIPDQKRKVTREDHYTPPCPIKKRRKICPRGGRGERLSYCYFSESLKGGGKAATDRGLQPSLKERRRGEEVFITS